MRRRHQSPRPKGRGMYLTPLLQALLEVLYLTGAQKIQKTSFVGTLPFTGVAGLKTTVGSVCRFHETVFLTEHRLPLQP